MHGKRMVLTGMHFLGLEAEAFTAGMGVNTWLPRTHHLLLGCMMKPLLLLRVWAQISNFLRFTFLLYRQRVCTHQQNKK
jgi:hypothetical protein